MSVVGIEGIPKVEEGEERIELLLGLDNDLHLRALTVYENGRSLNDGVELVGSRLKQEEV